MFYNYVIFEIYGDWKRIVEECLYQQSHTWIGSSSATFSQTSVSIYSPPRGSKKILYKTLVKTGVLLCCAKNSGIFQNFFVSMVIMDTYRTKVNKIPATNFSEVRRVAFELFKRIKRKSKRSPYVRSVYFKKDKIFLTLFQQHLFEKEKWQDRMRRLQYFEAAIELIEKSRFEPQSKENPNKKGEILHRFAGVTKNGDRFYVQIKEEKASGKKFLISFFPEK